MTEKLFGIEVYSNLITAGNNWWDIKDRINIWTKYFGGVEKHYSFIKSRFHQEEKLKNLLDKCYKNDQNLDKKDLSELKIKLSIIPSIAVPSDHLNMSPLRHKNITNLNKLEVSSLMDIGKNVKKTINCNIKTHNGCIKIKKQILSLIGDFGHTKLVPFPTDRIPDKDGVKGKTRYGFDTIPDKLKVEALKNNSKNQ
jgi:hypothetical protein